MKCCRTASAGDMSIQHDVSELNRILIDAIERSLRDTMAHDLIARLYRGISVQEIQCQACTYISRREEHFYDITVNVQGLPTLQVCVRCWICWFLCFFAFLVGFLFCQPVFHLSCVLCHVLCCMFTGCFRC